MQAPRVSQASGQFPCLYFYKERIKTVAPSDMLKSKHLPYIAAIKLLQAHHPTISLKEIVKNVSKQAPRAVNYGISFQDFAIINFSFLCLYFSHQSFQS